ncbi:uncharacterized protein Fot_54696 [Forsythia ovata]|uniref:Uncharacterized protein n=1 Tax=Forsythia ovata TaxID=205694 RepID=A0ABD1P6D8_9LAMI
MQCNMWQVTVEGRVDVGGLAVEGRQDYISHFDSAVREFLRDGNDFLIDDGMYQVSRTIFLAYVLAACFTNLLHLVTMKCDHKSIKEREKSVRQAARLLGETEEIIQQWELPSLDPDKAAYIEEWHSFLEQDNENTMQQQQHKDKVKAIFLVRTFCAINGLGEGENAKISKLGDVISMDEGSLGARSIKGARTLVNLGIFRDLLPPITEGPGMGGPGHSLV